MLLEYSFIYASEIDSVEESFSRSASLPGFIPDLASASNSSMCWQITSNSS